jgi:putative transposase
MAKSVLDAGWHMLKTMLEYKSAGAGVVFEEIDEKYTTQTCSSCGDKPPERPKGIAGLGIREWTCGSCGEHHDRDINAAKNILALGHQRLAGGITATLGR